MKLAVAVLLAGCDVAFGIHHQDPLPERDAPTDAPLGPVAGSVALEFVFNDANFQPTRVRMIPNAATLSIAVADRDTGVETPIAYDSIAGTFSVPRDSDERVRIVLHFGPTVIEYQWNLPVLESDAVNFSRIGEQVAAAGTTLSGTLAGVVNPLEEFIIYTTGIENALTATVTAGTYSVKWTGGLASGSQHDELIFAGYDTDAKGNAVLDRVQTSITEEIQSGANTIPVALPPFAATTCVDAITNLATDAARLDALYPSFGPGPTNALALVYALPAPDLGPGVAWQIVRSPGDTAELVASFRNIFPGYATMLAAVVARGRTLATGEHVGIQDVLYVPVDDMSCQTVATLPTQRAAFPNHFVLGGQPLEADDTPGPTATTFELAWDANGDADLFVLTVFDLSTGAVPRTIYTTAPRVTLDRAGFTSGDRYAFFLTSTIGIARIAQGDVTTHSYPAEATTVTTPSFVAR